jgi:hypothetical protein
LQARAGYQLAALPEKAAGTSFYVFNINALKQFFGLIFKLALLLLIPWYLPCGASRKPAKESHDQPDQHLPAAH